MPFLDKEDAVLSSLTVMRRLDMEVWIVNWDWIAGSCELVKWLLSHCVTCRKYECKPYQAPPPPPLPCLQMQKRPPFAHRDKYASIPAVSFKPTDMTGQVFYVVSNGLLWEDAQQQLSQIMEIIHSHSSKCYTTLLNAQVKWQFNIKKGPRVESLDGW